MADVHEKNHDYHILAPSPWPFLSSVGAFVLAIGGIAWMRYINAGDLPFFGINLATPWLFFIGLAIVLYCMYAWWSDAIKEGREGHHTRVVALHLRYGMIMFIASEVMFFAAWFWAFFDVSLFPNEVHQVLRAEFTGGQWPPKGLEVLDPLHLPVLPRVGGVDRQLEHGDVGARLGDLHAATDPRTADSGPTSGLPDTESEIR